MLQQYNRGRIIHLLGIQYQPIEFIATSKTTYQDILSTIRVLWNQKIIFITIYDSFYQNIGQSNPYYLNESNKFYISLTNHDIDTKFIFYEYNYLSELGSGGQGVVILGEHKITKKKVAIKMMHENQDRYQYIATEGFILSDINHQSIVKQYDYKLFPLLGDVVLVLEYVEGESLVELMKQSFNQQGLKILSENQLKYIFLQLVDALCYCHSKQIVHRDIKLDNILFNYDSNKKIKIKLIDFGLAVKFDSNDKLNVGTLPYMSPELLDGRLKKINPCIDVWAFGVVLYVMTFGKLPFNGNDQDEIMNNILSKNYIFHWRISEDLQDLFHKIFKSNFESRITMEQIKNHQWFKKNCKELYSLPNIIAQIQGPKLQLKQQLFHKIIQRNQSEQKQRYNQIKKTEKLIIYRQRGQSFCNELQNQKTSKIINRRQSIMI